ncbi:CDP-diacylglycerol--glycerol-3-phosphate 3-phosphatidyltransferase [Mactra antiquata]
MSDNKEVKGRFGWLRDHLPCFNVDGHNITVLHQPNEFYEIFKEMLSNARKRIVIAALYFDKEEHESALVDAVDAACLRSVQERNEKFEVSILLDYFRGSRGGNNSRTQLLPLLNKYKDRVNVYLYHTPHINGVWRYILPERVNEMIGLNHIKIYLVDDDFILCGGNLGQVYFTIAQDRYMLVKSCQDMSDYFMDLVKTVGLFSHRLLCDNTTVSPFSDAQHSDMNEVQSFKKYVNEALTTLNKSWREKQQSNVTKDSHYDTFLFPSIQMGPFEVNEDRIVVEKVLRKCEPGDRVIISTGYLNFPDFLEECIVNDSVAKFDIITASPQNSGFHGAPSVLEYVPAIYSYFLRKFHARIVDHNSDRRIRLYEYYKPDKIFHGKGLWYYTSGSCQPALTMIGSSNFGQRSCYRDLECQITMVTSNIALQSQLKQEHEKFFENATMVNQESSKSSDSYVPWLVSLLASKSRSFF